MSDLRQIFSRSEFVKGFRSLNKKKKKKLPQDLPRPFRYGVEKKDNALGKFLALHRTDNGSSLYDSELANYKMSPFYGLAIPKKTGKLRPLLVPPPLERLIFLTALPRVKRVIRTRMENYGVIGVGIEQRDEDSEAIRRVTADVQKQILDGKTFVLVLDFQNFFSSIDRKKLFRRLQPQFKKYGEERLWGLVRASINNQITMGPTFHHEFERLKLDKVGIPQGLAYSPLLASYYGTSIDRIVRRNKRVHAFRYLDDMIILGTSRQELENLYKELEIASKDLGLHLHELGTKSKIVSLKKSAARIDFLGVSISKKHLEIPDGAIKRFKDTIKDEILSDSIIKACSPEDVKRAFTEFVVGWSTHYKRVCPKHFENVADELNAWLQTVINHRKSIKKIVSLYPGVFRV